jgi:zinc/manganese transport system substrate-binding protein
MRRFSVCLFLVMLVLVRDGEAADKMSVVTTLSTYADLVRTIGGDAVEVTSIAHPRFSAHFIEPKPSDVLRVKRSNLFVHSGLDYELWRFPLVSAAGNGTAKPGEKGELDLSLGISLQQIPGGATSRAQGDIHIYGNPHYAADPENGIIIAGSIAKKLSQLMPESSTSFEHNLSQFSDRIREKMVSWKRACQSIAGREFVGYHNEWVYLMKFCGLRMDMYLEPKPGIPPTPQHVLSLEQYASSRKIDGIIQASFSPTEVSSKLAQRLGVPLLLLCQNVGEQPACTSYE